MSEEIAQPADTSPEAPAVPDWKRPRQKVTKKTKIALLAVIEAARYVKRPDLQGIAIRCGIKYGTLKQVWYRWNKGLVDLGEPETREDREIDMKTELARTMRKCNEIEQFLNDQLEGIMAKVRQEAAAGNKEAYFEHRVDRIVDSLLKAARLRETKEKGYLSMLEHATESQRKRDEPKPIEKAHVIEVAARVTRATDQQRLEQALAVPTPE